jgi:4-hydroxy-L-threonine phosphate dehydrogenase PdxA
VPAITAAHEQGRDAVGPLPPTRSSSALDAATSTSIAGTGRADERSMLAAIKQAIELAPKLNDALIASCLTAQRASFWRQPPYGN